MNNKLFKLSSAILFCLSVTIFTLAQNSVNPVNLNVIIDDSVSPFGIHSDGGGQYSAQFGQYGYFTLNSGNRIINAVYSPIEGNPSLQTDSKQGVVITTFADGTFLQNMVNGTSLCKGLAVKINMGDAAQTVRTIGYRAGRGDLTTTGFVKVTRVDDNNWIMESQGCSGALDGVARVIDAKTKGKPVPDINFGRYFMPLKLILTRQ